MTCPGAGRSERELRIHDLDDQSEPGGKRDSSGGDLAGYRGIGGKNGRKQGVTRRLGFGGGGKTTILLKTWALFDKRECLRLGLESWRMESNAEHIERPTGKGTGALKPYKQGKRKKVGKRLAAWNSMKRDRSLKGLRQAQKGNPCRGNRGNRKGIRVFLVSLR